MDEWIKLVLKYFPTGYLNTETWQTPSYYVLQANTVTEHVAIVCQDVMHCEGDHITPPKSVLAVSNHEEISDKPKLRNIL